MSKILVADDHALIRSALRMLLTSANAPVTVGEAASGGETLELVSKEGWDVVVLDINFPDLDGLEVLKRIKELRSDLPVLVFSMHSDIDYAMRAFDAGASGYLCKDSQPEQILLALSTVAGGAIYVSPTMAAGLLLGKGLTTRRLPHDQLSAREMEVLLMLSQGMSLIRIGQLLNISFKTVSTYRSRVLEKLNLNSNAQLTRYVVRNKLG